MTVLLLFATGQSNALNCRKVGLKTPGLFGKWLSVDYDKGVTVTQKTNPGRKEEWRVESKGAGQVALKSCFGRYLVAELSLLNLVFPGEVNANRREASKFETFTVFKSTGNLAVFQTYHQTALYIDDESVKHHSTVPFQQSVFEVRCVE